VVAVVLGTSRRWVPRLSDWRRESLRTTLWVLPAIEIAAAVVLFLATYAIDRAAYRGELDLPAWVNNGSADASRQILTAIAAAVITVVGLVFSITIVALTLASTQFGPRMLRNFIRDRGTQLTLGTFVATFVYAVLALGSVSSGNGGDFVPHLSITVALALVLIDLAVLVFFIHHVAKSIQLPEVIASIAGDLAAAIDVEVANGSRVAADEHGPSEREIRCRLEESGAVIPATTSGYLQFVRYGTLVEIAAGTDAVIELLHRPGHFVVEGLALARVWPADRADDVERSLRRLHAAGANRTLMQDLAFAIDQLVEIAIRALSPAVNDTFTAMTCVDWLGSGLSKLTAHWNPRAVHRDGFGDIRVIAAEPSYARLVDRAFDKIRQAGRGMPAVMIRQLDALTHVMEHTTNDQQRDVLLRQAEMLLRSSLEFVSEPADLADIRRRYDVLASTAVMVRGEHTVPEPGDREDGPVVLIDRES
jgi:uncharacterized membrane protein